MVLPQRIDLVTPEEYLRRERDAHEKHQYYHGEIFAMAGGTPNHSRVIANTSRAVGNRIEGGPCAVYDSNLRIRVPGGGLYTYPDISIICGELQFDAVDTRLETVINPILIVEVLSPSTEAWDRGGKFESYSEIKSLKEYVLIASQTSRVETFLRQSDGNWLYTATNPASTSIQLKSLNIELPLAEIYAGIQFPPPTDRPL